MEATWRLDVGGVGSRETRPIATAGMGGTLAMGEGR